MAQKPPPDHSPRVLICEQRLFTDEQISELRRDFTFRDDVPLDAWLEDEVYRCLTYPEHQSEADTRDLLKELHRKTEPMLDVLKRFGPREVGAIYDHASRAHPPFDWMELLNQVSKLNSALGRFVPELSKRKYKGSPQKDFVGIALIAGLRRIYKHGTGRDDRYTQTPDTSKYSGPFVQFVTRVSDIVGHPLSNSFIGDTLKEILQRAERIENHG